MGQTDTYKALTSTGLTISFLFHTSKTAMTWQSPSSRHPPTMSQNPIRLKTGKEMRWMMNSLIRRGVNGPVVCAIMLKGYTMYTYKMDLAYPHIYRMIELSSITICNNLQGSVALPAILRNMLQVKNIVKKTAVRAKIRANAKSMGIAPSYSPPLSYISSSNYHLRRVSSSDKKK